MAKTSKRVNSGSAQSQPQKKRVCNENENSQPPMEKHDAAEDAKGTSNDTTPNDKGDVDIVEVDSALKYIKLRNKGVNDISIGGWQLKRIVDGNEIDFVVRRGVKIDGSSTIIIWSADLQRSTQEASSNIVKNVQGIKIVLINNIGEEVAVMQQYKHDGEKVQPNKKRCNLM